MKSTLAVVALTLPLLAAAQTAAIWRCGADGSSYSATPCAEGRTLELPDARPAADLQAARDAAMRDKRLAGQITQQRLHQEAAQRGTGLGGFDTARQPVRTKAAVVVLRKPHQRPARHPEADGTWRAVAPASRPTKD